MAYILAVIFSIVMGTVVGAGVRLAQPSETEADRLKYEQARSSTRWCPPKASENEIDDVSAASARTPQRASVQ
jgi:hypothetical protein